MAAGDSYLEQLRETYENYLTKNKGRKGGRTAWAAEFRAETGISVNTARKWFSGKGDERISSTARKVAAAIEMQIDMDLPTAPEVYRDDAGKTRVALEDFGDRLWKANQEQKEAAKALRREMKALGKLEDGAGWEDPENGSAIEWTKAGVYITEDGIRIARDLDGATRLAAKSEQATSCYNLEDALAYVRDSTMPKHCVVIVLRLDKNGRPRWEHWIEPTGPTGKKKS